jgi:hypothetical protein
MGFLWHRTELRLDTEFRGRCLDHGLVVFDTDKRRFPTFPTCRVAFPNQVAVLVKITWYQS